MISTAAVESAAKVLYSTWDDQPEDWKASTRKEVRKALEASAPQMLAGQPVATEGELEILPAGAVVLSDSYTYGGEGCDWPISFQKWPDGDWHRGARSGSTHPDNFLPAVVIYEPTP